MIEKKQIAEENKSHFPRRKAKVVLFKCIGRAGSENLFGNRIEEVNNIWYRTWSFKISEDKARHEGWDTEKITSALLPTAEYNGCPYCGGFSIAQCPCRKMFCLGNKDYSHKNKVEIRCPWCGKTSVYQTAESFDVHGGGF